MLGIDLKKVVPKSQFLHHVHAAGPLVCLCVPSNLRAAWSVERFALSEQCAQTKILSAESSRTVGATVRVAPFPTALRACETTCVEAWPGRRLRGRDRLKLVVPSEGLMRCVARLPLQLLQPLNRLPRGKGLIPSSE